MLSLRPTTQLPRRAPQSLSLGSLGVATLTVKTAILAFILALAAQLTSRAQAPDISDAPKAIQTLSASIQGKSSAEVRTAIIERLGPAQRDIGSGLRIEQWDTSDGVLTFNPSSGPIFSDPKAKKVFRLLRTANPVRACLLKSYEMTTLPSNGTRVWLGNVEFTEDMTYRFTDSGQHPNQRGAQTENFFLLHPTGKVEARYIPPITPDTLLESLAEGTTVAHLTFTSADAKHQATFSITSSERSRRLDFSADKPLSFLMDTSWRSFWK